VNENEVPSLEKMIITRLDSNYHKLRRARDFADYLIELLQGNYCATYGKREADKWDVEGLNQMLDKIQRGIDEEVGRVWNCLTKIEGLIKEAPDKK